MLLDIVVDTNVLVHANNPNLAQCSHSIELIKLLLDCSTKICVDPGFDKDEALNKSQIGGEYFSKLHHGMMGYILITEAASQRRIKEVSRRIDRGTDNFLRGHGMPSLDRLFVKVASNSSERLLITHDDRHFTDHVCSEIETRLDVEVLAAFQAVSLIG